MAEPESIDDLPRTAACRAPIVLRESGEVSGAITTDDLLGRIFSTFCIGK
jgi:tRNA U34 5-carboxymethylaminomethyl modifying GTPase MnmE/TrmE